MNPRFSRILLPMEADDNAIIAASDPVFGDVQPDGFTAYVRLRVMKSFPMVVGPDMISGAVFGIHPAVIARSFESIIHKQMNLGHKMVYLGSSSDRVVGCVLQAAYPEEPEGGWQVPATVNEAPSITVLAALFKQAQGVDKMLGDHLSGKKKMAISIEFTFQHDQVGIYDPSTRQCYDRTAIPDNLKGFVGEDQKGRLFIQKSARNPQIVLALGGLSHRINFSGIGYTDRPAEQSAVIDSIAASRREGMMVCQVAAPALVPGMPVTWDAVPGIGMWGRGVIESVRESGVAMLNNLTLAATPEDPVLCLKLPDGKKVIRRASSVKGPA